METYVGEIKVSSKSGYYGERQTRDRDVHHLILHNHAYKQPLPQASEKATRLP